MIQKYLAALTTLWFPTLCFACGAKMQNGYLCPSCEAGLEFLAPPLCQFCATPIAHLPHYRCQRCQHKEFPYQRLVSALAYKRALIPLIHAFKYRHADFLAQPLCEYLIQQLLRLDIPLSRYDMIIPVPLHPAKRKVRGYNQSALLGKIIANRFSIPFNDDIIGETKLRVSQTTLTAEARARNTHDSFFVTGNLTEQHIVLIDDIVTTGATITACAQACIAAGAESVIALSLATTQ